MFPIGQDKVGTVLFPFYRWTHHGPGQTALSHGLQSLLSNPRHCLGFGTASLASTRQKNSNKLSLLKESLRNIPSSCASTQWIRSPRSCTVPPKIWETRKERAKRRLAPRVLAETKDTIRMEGNGMWKYAALGNGLSAHTFCNEWL
jgi:hypothetical protein